MSTLSLRLPDSLHETARTLARNEHVSVNQLISTAVAEKISALMTESYLDILQALVDEKVNSLLVGA